MAGVAWSIDAGEDPDIVTVDRNGGGVGGRTGIYDGV
jgi:hypothetical protein